MPAKGTGKVQRRILEALGEIGPCWLGELEQRLALRENELRQPLLVLERRGLVQADRSQKRTLWGLKEQS